MKTSDFPSFPRGLASRYIQASFDPGDRLAVVLLNKRTISVIQRIAAAGKIASEDFQEWLRGKNAQGHEIYISMNVLAAEARRRTKADIAAIRHLYLDFDENGTAAVRELFNRRQLPTPSHVLNTSPDKWQVTWRVEGFTKEEAEHLQKALARETGADPAATDCARVLRLPGFFNHKYDRPYLIRVEPHAAMTGAVYRPDQFPQFSAGERSAREPADGNDPPVPRNHAPGQISQSERDWAFAKRALSRGESPALVAAAIASFRQYDKSNPKYYADLTVRKAAESLRTDGTRGPERS